MAVLEGISHLPSRRMADNSSAAAQVLPKTNSGPFAMVLSIAVGQTAAEVSTSKEKMHHRRSLE